MLLARFFQDRRGGIAPLLALAIVPIVGLVGAGVDYSRASAARVGLQAALDSAMLYAAKEDSTTWQQTAANAFNAVVALKDATVATPVFSIDANGNYVGQATADVPTKIAGILGTSSIEISARSAVKPGGDADNSCLLTLDKGAALSNVSMLFGGAPNIQLAGCSTRSNTSLNCNGHGSGAAYSIAAGSASGCSNTRSYARVLPDIYERLAAEITKLCGGISSNVNWTPGTLPSAVKTVQKNSHTEYHVCGDLTVSGSGFLTGASPSSDFVIVIENGSLKLTSGASISAARTAIVLTGNNNVASAIDFPNGEGHNATLALTPPTNPDNPWKGIAIYQDPALTYRVANNWGPGATFNVDGVVYLPNSNVEMQGVAASNNYKCSKLVSKTFTTKGAVSLDFSQVTSGCKTIGMQQWSDTPIHLVN
ncbi:MAG TPA: TadE/TadG family type IV pilus assembly protein [Xanthobacteraceae bacterium]|nr:TadE/TadG family type IV pilus assembly protein [Xanthobacteraceae bacterium]